MKNRKQLGLAEEIFARYEGTLTLQTFASAKVSSSLQDEINRQLGVSQAVFAKYGSK